MHRGELSHDTPPYCVSVREPPLTMHVLNTYRGSFSLFRCSAFGSEKSRDRLDRSPSAGLSAGEGAPRASPGNRIDCGAL